jgi:pectate lyase
VDEYKKAGGTGGLKLTYAGTFDFATIPDPCTQHKLEAQILEFKGESGKPMQNITLIGADGSAGNFGIHIVGSAENIIIRNMTIGLPPGGGSSDIVGVEGNSAGAPKNIWVDHNTFFSSLKECDGAGDTEFDGMIDFKKGATNVTVSYNYLHDHHKVSLNGYSDSDTLERLITFHHNVFENMGSRVPLQRGGYAHILNNLFSNITTSGVNVRMGGYALVEGNYFENAKNPVTSRDSSALGYWELLNNNVMSPADFSSYGIKWVASDSSPSKNADDWTSTKTFPREKLGYAYNAQSAACVKSGLKSVAGAGKALATLKCA